MGAARIAGDDLVERHQHDIGEPDRLAALHIAATAGDEAEIGGNHLVVGRHHYRAAIDGAPVEKGQMA